MEEEKKIVYSIPDFFHYYNLNMLLIDFMDKQPGLFRENVKIGSVYGAFPGFIWNSGRAVLGQATYENITGTVDKFNELGISVRYTCSNAQINETHLNDYYSNRILEITENKLNGVTVNLKMLDDYISEKYPEFYHVWSTTKSVKSIDEVNELSKDRLTVLYYGMNNTDALDKLEHPENIEILVNEACVENCPRRKQHYEDVGKLQSIQPSNQFKCPFGCEQYFYYEAPIKRSHYVTPDMIENIYLPRGIYNFKISGRNDNVINLIENYTIYFAKPEHKDNVRNKLLISYFSQI